jgi:hypothetical protein
MKNILKLLVLFIVFSFTSLDHKPCGKYKGRNIYKGKEGGCYYLKGKDHRKIYIEKKHCKCK